MEIIEQEGNKKYHIIAFRVIGAVLIIFGVMVFIGAVTGGKGFVIGVTIILTGILISRLKKLALYVVGFLLFVNIASAANPISIAVIVILFGYFLSQKELLN